MTFWSSDICASKPKISYKSLCRRYSVILQYVDFHRIDTLSPTLTPALWAGPPGEIHKTLAHNCCCCCCWGSAGICCPTTRRPNPYGSWSSIRKRLIWLVLVGPEKEPCRLVSPPPPMRQRNKISRLVSSPHDHINRPNDNINLVFLKTGLQTIFGLLKPYKNMWRHLWTLSKQTIHIFLCEWKQQRGPQQSTPEFTICRS